MIAGHPAPDAAEEAKTEFYHQHVTQMEYWEEFFLQTLNILYKPWNSNLIDKVTKRKNFSFY